MPAPEAPPLLVSAALVRPTTAISRAVALLRDREPGAIRSAATVPQLGPALSQYTRDAAGRITGGRPSCVGCAFTHFLNAQPAPRQHLGQDFADELWAWARDHDGDPANNGDPHAGTYPFAAARHLRRDLGLVNSVSYVTTEREARAWNLGVPSGPARPVLFGTPWYESFDHPSVDGSVQLYGAVRGGHEYLGYYADQARKGWLCQQSWTGYAPYDAIGQIFFVPFATMRKLMNRGGTAALLTKPAKQ